MCIYCNKHAPIIQTFIKKFKHEYFQIFKFPNLPYLARMYVDIYYISWDTIYTVSIFIQDI